MKGAVRIARFAGIPVKVHWSFGLLVAWVVIMAYSSGFGWLTALVWLAAIAILFICVVLHEYGHALTARRFGVGTRDIVLTPIGGIARLENIPESPKQEILVAVAGPAVNILIGVILLGIFVISRGSAEALFASEFWRLTNDPSIIVTIAKINFILFAFNLIPAFPMDGGRVLRAILAIRLTRIRATVLAVMVGRVLAAGLVILGMYSGDLVLGLIGVFVYFAGGRELQAVRIKNYLGTLTAGQICEPHPHVVAGTTTIEQVAAPDDPWSRGDMLVLDADNSVAGVLFAEVLKRKDIAISAGAPVMSAASALFQRVDHLTKVKDLVELFRNKGYRIVPVYRHGILVGAVYRSHLEHLLRGRKPDLLNQ